MELSGLFPHAKFFGLDDRIPALTNKLADGEVFQIGSLYVKCIHTPGHTMGSASFAVMNDADLSSPKALFTGDTLFLGGCGRFFEGTAREMFTSLQEKIGSLPDTTDLYVGHEYSISNLEVIYLTVLVALIIM